VGAGAGWASSDLETEKERRSVALQHALRALPAWFRTWEQSSSGVSKLMSHDGRWGLRDSREREGERERRSCCRVSPGDAVRWGVV
jgi:hypothetical protein